MVYCSYQVVILIIKALNNLQCFLVIKGGVNHTLGAGQHEKASCRDCVAERGQGRGRWWCRGRGENLHP